jgi:hypothetical protein
MQAYVQREGTNDHEQAGSVASNPSSCIPGAARV